jgi:hypothetical protein
MAADFTVTASIRKASQSDDGAVYMYGWGAMSVDDIGEPVIDSDGHYIPIAALEKAVQTAFLRRGGSGAVGTMHEEFGRADLVESFVLSGEKRQAFGLGEGPQGWMVGLRSLDPEVAKAVRSGAMLELSLRGAGRIERLSVPYGETKNLLKSASDNDPAKGTQTVGVIRNLELRDVELLSIVDRGASANERVRSRIVLVKKEVKKMPEDAMAPKARTAQYILAELFEQGKLTDLSPSDKEVLLTSLAAAPAMPAPKPESKPEPKPEPEPKAEEKPMPKSDDESLPKADDEEETMKKEKELAKRNAELVKRVSELEKAAKRSELRDLVKRDMAYFPGSSVDEIVKVVEEARENMGKDEADKLVSMLKSASAVCEKSDLFKQEGIRKGGGSGNSNPSSELLELAKSLRDKDASLGRAQALIKAGQERPDLWAEYQRGRNQ